MRAGKERMGTNAPPVTLRRGTGTWGAAASTEPSTFMDEDKQDQVSGKQIRVEL